MWWHGRPHQSGVASVVLQSAGVDAYDQAQRAETQCEIVRCNHCHTHAMQHAIQHHLSHVHHLLPRVKCVRVLTPCPPLLTYMLRVNSSDRPPWASCYCPGNYLPRHSPSFRCLGWLASRSLGLRAACTAPVGSRCSQTVAGRPDMRRCHKLHLGLEQDCECTFQRCIGW